MMDFHHLLIAAEAVHPVADTGNPLSGSLCKLFCWLERNVLLFAVGYNCGSKRMFGRLFQCIGNG